MYVPESILVTGAAGFIASNLCAALVKAFPDATIVGVDKLDTCSSVHNLTDVLPHALFQFVKADFRNVDAMVDILQKNRVDTVLHLGANTHVDNSFGNSIEFTLNNMLGTHCMLEACRQVGGIRRFINCSTDEVYGETVDGTATETRRLLPTNPYAAAKAGAEMIARSYQISYGLPVITTRGNNVYGPRQYPEKLIPKFVLQCMTNRPMTIHGEGSTSRSYLHVDDVSAAFLAVLQRGVVGETYNIGTDHEIRVDDVAAELAKVFPDSSVVHVRDRLFNDTRYDISDAKLRALGWSPQISFEDGLRDTIEWYRHTDCFAHWNGVFDALEAHPLDKALDYSMSSDLRKR